MELKNKNILIISPENWGSVFLSKHHYALELSKKNKVWFLNAKGHRKNNLSTEFSKINKNLTVINYYNLFFGFGKIPFIISSLINYYLSKTIKRKIGKIDIVWSFEQAKFFNLKLFDAIHHIFHPVDYIPSLNKYKIKIAKSSDIIFSVSEEILKTIKSKKPKHFINHGLSEFEHTSPQVLKYPINKNKISVGYIGNVNIPFLDIDNLCIAIDQNTDCDFHFIGPTTTSNLGTTVNPQNYNKLLKYDNVHFQGVVEHTQLIETITDFDILISCYDYKKNPIRLSNSHKILEYMSTGKVILSNYFPTYSKLNPNLIIMMNSNDDFGITLKETIKKLDVYNNSEFELERIKFAKNNSYKNQINLIEQHLNNLRKL
jgi:hypothetical protein